jgi:hypothetical protein
MMLGRSQKAIDDETAWEVNRHLNAGLCINATVAASQAANACSSPVLVMTSVARFASGINHTSANWFVLQPACWSVRPKGDSKRIQPKPYREHRDRRPFVETAERLVGFENRAG